MASTSDQSVYRATTTAPVNIAVIKYAALRLPLIPFIPNSFALTEML